MIDIIQEEANMTEAAPEARIEIVMTETEEGNTEARAEAEATKRATIGIEIVKEEIKNLETDQSQSLEVLQNLNPGTGATKSAETKAVLQMNNKFAEINQTL